MQEERNDGTYTKPIKYDQMEFFRAMKRIDEGSTKRLLIFATKDSHGKPTKEARRAWRRYNKGKGHK